MSQRPAFITFSEAHSQRPARLRADDIDSALLAQNQAREQADENDI